MRMMRVRLIACLLVAALPLVAASPASAQKPKKDYLSEFEADKIRDAETPSERIRLFVLFAADRMKKFQYEMAHPSPSRHAERLNGLLNAYTGCVDDGAALIELAIDKQQDIHAGIKEMQTKAKEFLAYLQDLAKSGAELSSYRDTLDDAIEATQDALKDAERAAKEIAPPPVRRKP